MYRLEAAAFHEKPTSACPTACGPSSASANASSGSGTITADHTVSDSPPRMPEARHHVADAPRQAAEQAQAQCQCGHVPTAPDGNDDQPECPQCDPDDLSPGRQLTKSHGGDDDREDHLRLQHQRRETGGHARVHGGVQEPELTE